MSLTIDNNRLAQQQMLPAKAATAQTAADAVATAAGTSATASPAAQMISGNAGLTSGLLSVLLQEQSNAGTASSGPVTTLAGMLDAQDQAQGAQNPLDPSAAAQSATSTDSFMSGLQDLLTRLKAVG